MIHKLIKRAPDYVIGPADEPYMLRWWLIPKNRFFNIYLHKFLKSDDDRALHDHPWISLGMILEGEYIEHFPKDRAAWDKGDRETLFKVRKPYRPVFRGLRSIHRVELYRDWHTHRFIPVWTLFITGPKMREWGFWCPQGFKHWEKFVKQRYGGNEAGPGCED